jgi:hypothetical protein
MHFESGQASRRVLEDVTDSQLFASPGALGTDDIGAT